MNVVPHVHTSFLYPFIDYLIENGCPAQKYVRMAKLPEGLMEKMDGYVSERYIYQMLNIAARREGIDDFGLQVARPVSVAALGELGEQMAAMPTLHASLDLFCRKICNEVISHIGFWLTNHDGKTWFCRTPPPGFDHGLKYPEQFAILFMIKLIRMFTDENWCPKEVWLRSNNKREFIDHPDFKNTKFRFGKNITAVALPSLTEENSIVQNCLAPPEIIVGDTNQSLRKLLKMYLPNSYPGIEIAADLTGISSSTLKRHLAKSNLSFRDMMHQIRFELSCQMLETTDATIEEISRELSYSSASNFSRAFRQWSGISPQEYRLQKLL